MKFRGKIVESHYIRKFYTIISTTAKIAKTCVIRLTTEKVFFIIADRSSVSASPSVWAEIEQENFFNEYNLEGVTPEQNEIYLEFSPDKLFKTLNSLKSNSARGLKIKLTKKNDVPCLTFEVELPSEVDTKLCVHDVPVQVIPRRIWSDYEEPALPRVDVSLCLPELKKLKHLSERYKTLGNTVHILARREGTLSLKVETDDVSISTHYKDLRCPVFRDQRNCKWQISDDNDVSSASVRVDLKRLSQLLCGEQLLPERSVVNIVEKEALQIVMLHQDFLFQFFLPRTSKL